MADKGISPGDGDVVGTTIGSELCIYNPERLKLRDTEHFSKCEYPAHKNPPETMLINGTKLPEISSENLDKQTYAAICAGCHALSYQLIGPPLKEIQKKYKDNPEGFVNFAKAPVQVRSGFPQMPPQGYLGDEKLNAVAEYMLKKE